MDRCHATENRVCTRYALLTALAAGCLAFTGCSDSLSSSGEQAPVQRLVILPSASDSSAATTDGTPVEVLLNSSQALVRPNLDIVSSNTPAAPAHTVGPASSTPVAATRPRPPGAMRIEAGSANGIAAKPVGTWRRFISKPSGLKVRLEGTTATDGWHLDGDVIEGTLEVGPGFPTRPGQTAPPGLVNARASAFIPLNSLALVDDTTTKSGNFAGAIRELLQASNHPDIALTLRTLTLKGLPKTGDEPYSFDAVGEIVCAGVTNELRLPLMITPIASAKDQLRVTGQTTLDLTQLGLLAAQPLAGPALGDEMKLSFEWTVENQDPIF